MLEEALDVVVVLDVERLHVGQHRHLATAARAREGIDHCLPPSAREQTQKLKTGGQTVILEGDTITAESALLRVAIPAVWPALLLLLPFPLMNSPFAFPHSKTTPGMAS